ncbi:hypothetical protein PRIPAC_71454 [Pristionchus pacificus]|uniref:Uncharacterized protein n=1 Tax=Pristionchus pacificus TaxID=54126 RepID=A0A2A6CZE3_PRIPA|nr:hypothetical protein PRIPAC_71454 [Pristionchus pacificus]|eukprot:PDM83535.1 hypothetical protein PRIPAC_30022 [Pristionchus pacificus]
MITHLVGVLVLSTLISSRLYEIPAARVVRQTLVSSNGNSDGKGDNVTADASAFHYKNADGTIGMNVSSTGNATSGNGNGASIENIGQGAVGSNNIGSTGNISASGPNSNVFSDIFGEIYGNQMSVNSQQEGKSFGTGDTSVKASGNANLTKNGVASPSASDNNVANAGATGSDNSEAEVKSNQILTWDQLIAQLYGHAKGSGKTNAQANVDLGAGNNNNGIEVNGLVSGANSNGGNVNAEVEGKGSIDGSGHNLSGGMNGAVNGTGNSQLVGAQNLQSNRTGTNTTISTFGDGKSNGKGDNSITLNSNSSANSNGSVAGQIDMQNAANGGNKNMTVQNGLQVNDNKGGTLAIGYGEIKGNGTENSAANIGVNSQYDQNGHAQVNTTGVGNAVSNNQNSSLTMEGNAQITNPNGTKSGTATASGNVSGAYNNLTGTNQVVVGNGGANGNAHMEANGGGPGDSAAETKTDLVLKDGNITRTSSVSGSVKASGDSTIVKSVSDVSDQNGVQTLTNYQHAQSNSKGSSSASASNSGWLKRRKRASLGVLFDRIV